VSDRNDEPELEPDLYHEPDRYREDVERADGNFFREAVAWTKAAIAGSASTVALPIIGLDGALTYLGDRINGDSHEEAAKDASYIMGQDADRVFNWCYDHSGLIVTGAKMAYGVSGDIDVSQTPDVPQTPNVPAPPPPHPEDI